MKTLQFHIILLCIAFGPSVYAQYQDSIKVNNQRYYNAPQLFKPLYPGHHMSFTLQDEKSRQKKQSSGLKIERDLRWCHGIVGDYRVVMIEVLLRSLEQDSIHNLSVEIIAEGSPSEVIISTGSLREILDVPTEKSTTVSFKIKVAKHVKHVPITLKLLVPGQVFTESHTLELKEHDCW